MSALGFYTMMGYPTPLRSEFFVYQKSDPQLPNRPVQAFRSRVQPPSERMQKYIALITRWQRVWKHIPGVQSVYLANSITFNSIREGSNIDFFVITNKNILRTTRILVTLVFWFVRVWEKQISREMRFSADFFISQDNQDLSRILLSPTDPYLVYRLAHLVPLYHRDFVYFDGIYEENKRLQYYLPNFSEHQTIFLGIDVLIGSSLGKRIGDWIYSSWVGRGIELVSKFVSMCMLRWKKYRFPVLAPHILLLPGLYKSYDDKRKRYALQRELFKKTLKKDKN